MTKSKLFTKLRFHNRKNSRMLLICMILSSVLVSSYAMIYASPTIQTILPTGGDSRKQAVMIFALAIAGCAVFTTYASSLFLKSKSRDMGILLALGADKRQLEGMLFREILLISAIGSAAGTLLGIPVSFGIWKLFQWVIIDTREMSYQFGVSGLAVGNVFGLAVLLCVLLLAIKFVRRTNIIDIIQEQRRAEPIREIKRWYAFAGAGLIIGGVFLGYLVPMLVMQFADYVLSPLWNVTYLLAGVGLYLVMLYLVGHARRGRHPKRYYRNLISMSMMRFMGRQTVRNMCVIALLIIGALFAIFYVPTMVAGYQDGLNKNPVDYSFTYKQSQEMIEEEEIRSLAEEYGVSILDYREVPSIQMIVDGNEEEWKEDGSIVRVYARQNNTATCFSETEYAKLSGKKVEIEPGEYLTVVPSEYEHLSSFGHVRLLTHPTTGEVKSYQYAGNTAFGGKIFAGQDIQSLKLVLCDEDYEAFARDLPDDWRYRTVQFQVPEWRETYNFARRLKNIILERTDIENAVAWFYDDYQAMKAQKNQETYFVDEEFPKGKGAIELSTDNGMLSMYWKYYPAFKPLMDQDLLKSSAVFLMLFVYIALICFTAVGIIAYTRGITIAINHRQVFLDLRHLGADTSYLIFCMKSQLRRIFFYPAAVGGIILYLFYMLLLYNNDSMFSSSEITAMGMNLVIMAAVYGYLYLVYRLTCRNFKKRIGISA